MKLWRDVGRALTEAMRAERRRDLDFMFRFQNGRVRWCTSTEARFLFFWSATDEAEARWEMVDSGSTATTYTITG